MSNTAEMTDREIRSQIWARLRNYRGSLVLVMVCLTVSVPFMNFHPMVWGIVADRLVADTLTPSVLGLWLAIMFATYLIGIMVGALQSYLLEKTGQAVVRDFRTELFAKFQQQSLSFHRSHSTGELVTRMTSDIDAMEQSVLQGLTRLVGEVLSFSLCLYSKVQSKRQKNIRRCPRETR